MNDISQICDIHIESSTEATAFGRRQDPDLSAVDGPFFSQGMVGTVTTTITSNANSHREDSTAKVATRASRHRPPVLSRLYKAKDTHPESKTDNSKGNRTQSNQLLETESRIGRWSYTLTNSRIRDESPARSAPAIPKMTKEEFDALPPIIQRKVSYDIAPSAPSAHNVTPLLQMLESCEIQARRCQYSPSGLFW